MQYMKKWSCTQQKKIRSSPGMLLNFFGLFKINSKQFSLFSSLMKKTQAKVGMNSITHQSMLLSAKLTLQCLLDQFCFCGLYQLLRSSKCIFHLIQSYINVHYNSFFSVCINNNQPLHIHYHISENQLIKISQIYWKDYKFNHNAMGSTFFNYITETTPGRKALAYVPMLT